jgi:hypothetical protein
MKFFQLVRHMDDTPRKSFLETDIDAADITDELGNLSIAQQVVVEDRSETVDFIPVEEETEILCVSRLSLYSKGVVWKLLIIIFIRF